MVVKFKEIEKKEYEALCEIRDVPLTQNYFYGEWQIATGKKVWRFAIEGGGKAAGFFQVIKYPISFGKSYLYIPHGPVFTAEVSREMLIEFKNFCMELLKSENSIFLRFDTGAKIDGVFFKSPKYTYDGSFQPKYESVLDLTLSEDDILAGMKKVNRYTVRQAEKAGVTVEIVENNFLDHLDKFFNLIEGTAERDGFSHGSKDYYKKILEKCEEGRNGFMTVARFNGEVMLVNFFVIYSGSAFFLFSGSENQNRKIGYTYLAQWEAIKYAKKIGLKKYNFGAVILEDNEYPFYKGWHGFSDFKKRFGGSLIEYTDYYDVIQSKFWYFFYIFSKIKNLFLKKFFH
jgi:lipid II:glycine glycyltransferase (peptidoglycan interpeptide bridge formation enzyme)